MSRTLRASAIGALLVVAVTAAASPAAAQMPSHVRVVTESARILRWRDPAPPEVLLNASRGTALEVLDEDADWYWVVVPPNAHGTRRVGWIASFTVEPFTPPRPTPKTDPQREETLSRVVPPASATPPPTADDKVTISDVRGGGTVSSSTSAGAAKTYTFGDVHFERNRYALLPEDMEALRTVVAALKADSSLVVDIEGHTCNLGTAPYNLALGFRRANAVKDYLVSQGIAADRLHTVSLGETQAKHDNAHEETRRLNRRAVLVPNTPR